MWVLITQRGERESVEPEKKRQGKGSERFEVRRHRPWRDGAMAAVE